MKKTIIISAIALLLVVGIARALTLTGSPQEIKELMDEFQQQVEIEESELGGMPVAPVDVIGTRTGTSTTYVNFAVTGSSRSATTTYPTFIGRDIDEAIYSFYIGEASSSATLDSPA